METLQAEFTGAALHAAFEHGTDDLGDGGLETLRGVDGREVAAASGVEGRIVEAAELAEAEGGLGAAA